MTPSKQAFVARLLQVLGPRKRHSWGAKLGFTNNRIHRLFKEEEPLPSTEELALIGDAENLSLDWLVYEIGPRYRVQNFLEAAEFNKSIEDLLSKWGLDSYLVVNQNKCAIITFTRLTLEYKSRPINISELRCHTGPGSSKLQSLLLSHSITGIVFPTYCFEELEAGELGTYALFGDHRTRGLIETMERQDAQWLLGNMPLSVEHDRIDLITLISCYTKVQSFKATTGQSLNERKVAELTWVMYQTEINEKHGSGRAQINSEPSPGSWKVVS